MKEKIEQTLKLIPVHSFVSFIAAARLNNERYLEPVLSNIIVSTKSPSVIAKF